MTLHDIAAAPHAAWLAVAAALGLVFGSFVTALSYRLPRKLDFVAARSRCPSCGMVLDARDLVPVLSWIVSGGRCRGCKADISARYPLTEMLMAALFVSAAWQEPRLPELILLWAAAVLMMTIGILDLETRTMPLPLLALLAVVCAALRWIGAGDLVQGMVVAAVIVVSGLSVAAATRAWRGAPLVGAGDVYALAAASLAVPWPVFPVFLGLAGLLALAFGLSWRAVTGQTMFPFAPALFCALWPTLLFSERMAGFAA